MIPTPKEREIYYRRAAERIANGLDELCCLSLRTISLCTANRTIFPEFFMFEHGKDGVAIWWEKLPNGEFDRESRIIALLLCAEMCKSE